MRCLTVYIIISILLPATCLGQQLQQIPHCPSNEIYDMMFDHKGFLWIAHSLGISRYDGVSFTSFTNRQQGAISMTDLIEDDYGRIWYHNFNGQIFYIQNEKSHFLNEYDFKTEKLFPRMVLCKGELIITSLKGLFICDTKTMKCHYLHADPETSNNLGIHDLCLLNGKVVAYAGRNGWYLYSKEAGLMHLQLPSKTLFSTNSEADVAKLEPRALNDTFFMVSNAESLLYSLAIKQRAIVQVSKKELPSYVNTITIVNNNAWVNTVSASFPLHGTDTIKNYSITKILYDKTGTPWISSLLHGLMVYNSTPNWKIIQTARLSTGDNIKCIKKTNSKFILCSQLGNVFLTASPTARNYLIAGTLLRNTGTPENIENVFGHCNIIELSKGIYALDDSSNTLKYCGAAGIKNISVYGNTAYYSTASGMFFKNIHDWGLNNNAKENPLFFDDSILYINNESKIKSLRKSGRCRAVLFDSISRILYMSFPDGLSQYADNKITLLPYDDQPLYVSSLAYCQKKVYAATFNNGLFVIAPNHVSKIHDDSKSPLDAIVKVKTCNNHLWIFRTRDIQVLDAKTDSYINIPPLPVDIADIADVDEDSSNIYLATYHGLFTTSINTGVNPDKTPIVLLYALSNNTDTIFESDPTLTNTQNNLVFKLAIPVYNNADRLHFKYALINGSSDTTWYYTQDMQRDIQFNALKPGQYTFEAIATKDDEVVSTAPLVYNFTIQQPWFATWWFYTAVILSIIAALLALQQYRLRQVLKIERIRRNISNDLHDDIGSTLSSINVYSQLAKTEQDNREYINTIQQNAVSVINNLDDLVWNINPKNDVLENMIARMNLFAEPLLTQNNIQCVFTVEADNLQATITPDLRTNVYLLFKEAVNNVIKHARANTCVITLSQKARLLVLSIKDDGRGFDTQLLNRHRNGLHSMQQRVSDIRGNITINTAPGRGTEITVTCHLK